jgi:hypothetical protein
LLREGCGIRREKISYVVPQFKILFMILGVVWVGGGGYLMFRYPEFFARINARFGFTFFATPKFIKFTRWVGIIEMILAGLSLVNAVVMSLFGVKWY